MPQPPRSEYAFVILLGNNKADEKPSPMNDEPPTERLSVSSIATDGIASSMSRYDAEPLLSGALTKFVPIRHGLLQNQAYKHRYRGRWLWSAIAGEHGSGTVLLSEKGSTPIPGAGTLCVRSNVDSAQPPPRVM